MARTVHHTPYRHRHGVHTNHVDHPDFACTMAFAPWRIDRAWFCEYTGPEHTITDLRYPALARVVAARTGTRVIPQQVTARLERGEGPRAWVSANHISEDANLFERAARARLRVDARSAVGYANAALTALRDTDPADLDEDAWDDAFDGVHGEADIRPVRHRNSAIWNAW